MNKIINARLASVDREQVLFFLGITKEYYPIQELEKIDKAIETVVKNSEPKIVYKHLDFEVNLLNAIGVSGNDISDILEGCIQVVVFSATIGQNIDRLISRYMVSDMPFAVVLNAAANAAIEAVCDNFENDMRILVEESGLYLSERFSPGYGDFPIESQKSLCEYLNSSRRIGLMVEDNYMMTPIKSVSAVMGISEKRKPCRIHRCENCSMAENCQLRNSGNRK